MSLALQIFPNCHPPQPRDSFTNLNSDHANHIAFIKQDERMMTSFEIVGMVLDVGVKLPAVLKQHLATDVVQRTPLLLVRRRSQFMLAHGVGLEYYH